MRGVVHYAVVDLVANQPEVVLLSEGHELVPLGLIHVATGGVAREVVQDGHRVLIHSGLKVLEGRDETVLEGAWVQVGLASANHHVRRVQGKVGLGQQHVVPGIYQG